MKTLSLLMLSGALAFASDQAPVAPAARTAPDPAARLLRDASLMLLREGNLRYATGKSQHPNLDAERRSSTVAQGQDPFATILGCSDSREPVELIFDRGVGDLFIVRVAGNIAGSSELASVEYGVGHLNTPLLVVMGHTKCGAVTAVVKGAELHGHLPALAAKIKPAADKAKAETTNPDAVIPKAIEANVWQTISDVLRRSSEVRAKVLAGKAHIVGAVYDLETGKVNWLGSHPDQDLLITQGAIDDPGHGEPAAPVVVKRPAPGRAPLSPLSTGNLLPLARHAPETEDAHGPAAKPVKNPGH